MKTKFRMLSALMAVAMLVTMLSFGTLSVSAAPAGYTQAGTSEVYYKLATHVNVVDYSGNSLYIQGSDDNGDGGINIEGAAAALKAAAAGAAAVVIDASITAIGDGWFDGTNVGAVVVEGAEGSSLTISAGSFKNMPKLRQLIIARDNITWAGLSTATTVDGLLNPADAAGKTGGINMFVADDDVAASLQALDNTATLAKNGARNVNKRYAAGIYDITTTVDWRFRNAPGGTSATGTSTDHWLDWVYSDGLLHYDTNEEAGARTDVFYGSGTVKRNDQVNANRTWKDYLGQITKLVIGEGCTDFALNGGEPGFWGYVNAYIMSYSHTAGATNWDAEGPVYPNLEEIVLPSTFTTIARWEFANTSKLSKINLEDTAVTSIGGGASGSNEAAFRGTALTEIELPAGIQTVTMGSFCVTPDSGALEVIVNAGYPAGFSTSAFQAGGYTAPTVKILCRNAADIESWTTAFTGVSNVTVEQYVEPSEPEQPGDGDDDEPVVDADGYTQAGSSEVWYKLATHVNVPRYTGNSLYIKGVDGDEDGGINIEGAAAALKAAAAGAAAVVIDASITAIGDGWFDGTNVGAVVVEGAEGSSLTISAGSFKNMPKLRQLIIARDNITWAGLSTATTVDGLLNPADAAGKTGGINIFIADDDVVADVQDLDNAATLAKTGTTAVNKPYATGIYDIGTDLDWRFINKLYSNSADDEWVDWVYSDGTLYYDINEEVATRTDVFFCAARVHQTARADQSWKDHVNDIKKIVIGEGLETFFDYQGLGGYWAYAGTYIVDTQGSDTNVSKVGPIYPNLEEVVLPSTFTKIGTWEFGNTATLSKINLEDTAVASIGSSAFAGTALKSVELPEALPTVEAGAFNSVIGTTETLEVIVNAAPTGFSTSAFQASGYAAPTVKILCKNAADIEAWTTAFAGAGNVTVEQAKALTISKPVVTDDKKASVTYKNDAAVTGAAPQAYILIVAAYYDNALVDVDFIEGTMALGTSGTITTDAVDDVEGYEYKAMLWDGFATLNPLK